MRSNILEKKRGTLISFIFVVLGVFGMQGVKTDAGNSNMFLGDNIPHIAFEE